jgi:hypothetical protein
MFRDLSEFIFVSRAGNLAAAVESHEARRLGLLYISPAILVAVCRNRLAGIRIADEILTRRTLSQTFDLGPCFGD